MSAIRVCAAMACALAVALSACARSAPEAEEGWRAIVVTASAAAPNAAGAGARFGALVFRGGLVLESSDKAFGGWSGLKVDKSGALIAVSDQGQWLSLTPVLDGDTGALVGVADTKMASLRDLSGAPLKGKEASDAEGLARLADGRYAVSFEGDHRIWLYDIDGAGPEARAVRGPSVADEHLRPNAGLEALTSAPGGVLVAGAEDRRDGESGPPFFKYPTIAADAAPAAAGLAQVSPDYSLVDMDQLPDGDLVALERFFAPGVGNGTVIRRYYAAGLAAKTPTLAGPQLAALASVRESIDNFEGVAAVLLPNGGTRLYIISDNNFSPIQRTLLYAFDFAEDREVPPAGRAN